jgi:hypothetical protein
VQGIPGRWDMSEVAVGWLDLLGCAVADAYDDVFEPSASARSTLRWAHELGASTLSEAYHLLEQLEVSNDVPEVLGQEDTIEDVREEFELGIDLVGPDAPLSGLL